MMPFTAYQDVQESPRLKEWTKHPKPSCSVYFYLYGSNQCNILHSIKNCSNIEKNYIEYTLLCNVPFFPTPSCGKIHVSCSCNHELVAVFHLTMSAFWSCFSVIVIWLSKRLNRDISWKCGNALKGPSRIIKASRMLPIWDIWLTSLMMLQEFQHHILAWFLHTGICKILQHRKYQPYKQPPNLMEVDERISKSLPTCERQVPKDVIKPVSWRTRRKVLRMHGFVQCKQKSKNKGHVRYCLVFLVIVDPSSKIEALTVCFNKIRWSTRVASTWWMIMSQLHM